MQILSFTYKVYRHKTTIGRTGLGTWMYHKIHFCRYLVMMNCWKASPKERPSFREIHKDLSMFTERVAGYLDMGFNPFKDGEKVSTKKVDNEM